MANRQWYTAIGGRQEGPFSDERLRELIAAGTVRADSLVWCDGMSTWAKAAEIPGLMSAASSPSRPATALPALATAAPAVNDEDRLVFDPQRAFDRVWPLFWRYVVVVLSTFAVVPLPWAAPWFIGWFVEKIELPERRRISFAGKPGDIWYIFILYALCIYAPLLISLLLSRLFSPLPGWLLSPPGNWLILLLFIPLTTFFALIITRWFYANLTWPERAAPLQFTGTYPALLGWFVLSVSLSLLALIALSSLSLLGWRVLAALVSVLLSIAWAWVYTAWARWMCRNVQGSTRQFVFTSTVWSFLWRTATFSIVGCLLVPLPWIMRWYVRWLVSRFALVGESVRSSAAA